MRQEYMSSNCPSFSISRMPPRSSRMARLVLSPTSFSGKRKPIQFDVPWQSRTSHIMLKKVDYVRNAACPLATDIPDTGESSTADISQEKGGESVSMRRAVHMRGAGAKGNGMDMVCEDGPTAGSILATGKMTKRTGRGRRRSKMAPNMTGIGKIIIDLA